MGQLIGPLERSRSTGQDHSIPGEKEQLGHFEGNVTMTPTDSLGVAKSRELSDVFSWRRHLQLLVPILAVYLSLSLYGIGRQSLWEDEFRSVQRIASSRPIWQDGHGFLYFALLRSWARLGTSEAVLRSLSALLGAAAVCLLYALGHVLLQRRVAAVGTLLFATSPFLIWYAQEVRYITLVLVTTLLTMHAFRWVIRSGRLGSWLTYGGTCLLAFFSFLSTLLLPMVQGFYLLGSLSRRALLRKWIACQLIVLVLFAAWFVSGTHYLKAFVESRSSSVESSARYKGFPFPFSGDFNDVRPAVLPYTFFALSAGFSLGPPPRELYSNRSLAPLLPYAPLLSVLAVLYGGLLLSGLVGLRHQRDSRLLLALWVGVPILCTFGIAKSLDIFYDVRYVAMVLPAYLLLVGAGIVGFQSRAVQTILLCAVLTVHFLALRNYYSDPRYAREDTRSAGQFLESAASPGDAILVVGTLSSLPYYYKGNLPPVSLSDVGEAAQPLTERLRKFTADCDRVWLVQIRPWQMDRAGEVKAALDRTLPLVQSQSFPGVEVYAYHHSR
jgi:mannosyltransferase